MALPACSRNDCRSATKGSKHLNRCRNRIMGVFGLIVFIFPWINAVLYNYQNYTMYYVNCPSGEPFLPIPPTAQSSCRLYRPPFESRLLSAVEKIPIHLGGAVEAVFWEAMILGLMWGVSPLPEWLVGELCSRLSRLPIAKVTNEDRDIR